MPMYVQVFGSVSGRKWRRVIFFTVYEPIQYSAGKFLQNYKQKMLSYVKAPIYSQQSYFSFFI